MCSTNFLNNFETINGLFLWQMSLIATVITQ